MGKTLPLGMILVAVGLLALADLAPGADAPSPVAPAEQASIAAAVAPSLVCVEYTLQYDRGEAPYGSGWTERCPSCGSFHSEAVDSVVQEERPAEVAGYLVAPNRVVTSDLSLHPRFIKSIVVRQGSERVEARRVAYARDQNAVILELAQPLKSARPLVFDAARKPPYFAVTRAEVDGTWCTTVQALPGTFAATDAGEKFISALTASLVVDRTGAAVGLSMNERLPLDDSWKGSPAGWPVISQREMESLLATLEKRAGNALLRVGLSFRSPKGASPHDQFARVDPNEESGTQRNAIGLLLEDRKILVLANLKPTVTARLERILVHPAQGDAVGAKLAHSLKDYGAFVAELEKPLPGAMKLSTADVQMCVRTLQLAVEVRLQGEKRVAYFTHQRIPGLRPGWRRQLYPELPSHGQHPGFLVSTAGELLALPLQRREIVTEDNRWQSENPTITAACYLAPVLANLEQNSDPANTPVGEDQESRIAWMGVELQGLNKELARANNVSDLTSDGQSGALVTYVHPGSPAAAVGIEAGSVLLRLYVPGQPKPLDVRVQDSLESIQGFPWDRLDEVPEEYFDQIPKPWPAADSMLNTLLTDIGFGKKYTAEFFHDGQVLRKEFEVTPSPSHYDSAAKFKADPLGVTARDLTYEVRRYFQLKEDDPGVILSKVEQGSKASTSGLKPYEIITHVNDQPVKNVKDFERLTRGQAELRLSVKRMAKGRQVKVQLPRPKN